MKHNITSMLKDMAVESAIVSIVISNKDALVRYDLGKYGVDIDLHQTIDIEKMLLVVIDKMLIAWTQDKDVYSKEFRKSILPKLKELSQKYPLKGDKKDLK